MILLDYGLRSEHYMSHSYSEMKLLWLRIS